MKVTIEMIDQLRERVNVSYEEAKAALEKADGDLVQAVIELERKNNQHRVDAEEKRQERKERVHKWLRLDFIIRKEEKTYLRMPFVAAAIITLLTMPVSLVALFILVLCGFQVRINKRNKADIDLKETMQNAADKIRETAQNIFEEEK